MGISGNFTLFTNSAGGGTGSSDYVKDAFSDISVPATDNAGLTSTVSTNPLGKYFSNDDAPKYGGKTLFVKDLVLVEDRTKWINSKPTYEVIWNETYPGVVGYCYGEIRLRNNPQGISVEVRNIDDGFGVTGVLTRAAFICNPNNATGTADIVVDGADSGTDATFGSSTVGSGNSGINVVLSPPSASQTKNIHDYRLTANQDMVMSICGVFVFFENSGANIECFPGSTYVDKEKITTTTGATLDLTTYTGKLGGNQTIVKTSGGVYTSSSLETPTISTTGSAASSSSTIDVTTGQGASFPAGTGVVGVMGTSFYVGSVVSVSTDTLTVTPATGFTLNSTLYRAWSGGATLPISSTHYALKYSFDPGQANVFSNTNGFGQATNGDFYYSDPQKRYRIWGDALSWTFLDGKNGVGFTNGSFLSVTGRFSAAEIEMVAAPGSSAILHGTFSINGVPSWSANTGFTGNNIKTVFTNAGNGVNTFVFGAGASFSNVIFNKINFYQPNYDQSATFGILAYIPQNVDKVGRTAVNASFHALGIQQRIFADEMYFTGGWVRGTTHTQAGGVYYQGASTNSTATIYYYGTDYAVIGAQGISNVITFDGGAASSSLGFMQSVATLGFHTVVVTSGGSSIAISAFDYVRPRSGVVNLQNYLSTPQQDDAFTFWNQTDTPVNPKNGDIWSRFPGQNQLWIYGFGRWNLLSVATSIDDPNASIFIKALGFSGSDDTTGTNTMEMFNSISWQTGPSGNSTRSRGSCANTAYSGKMYCIGGNNTSSSSQALNDSFNKASWQSEPTPPVAESAVANHNLGSIVYSSKGAPATTPSSAVVKSYLYNGSAWSTGNDFATATAMCGCGVVSSIMSVLGGFNTSTSPTTTHETKNTSDTVSSATVVPTAAVGYGGGEPFAGMLFYAQMTAADNTTCYSWNGAAWSSAITATYTGYGQQPAASGSYTSNGFYTQNGGSTSGGSAVNTSMRFNGVATSSDVSSATNRGSPYGGVA